MSNPNTLALYELAQSHQRSQVFYAALKYGFVDLLKDGPKSGEEIAALAQTHEERTCRALRFAAAIGFFARDPQTLKYSLNDVSRVLIDDPNQKWLLSHLAHPHTVQTWCNLSKTLKDGSFPHKELFGGNFYDYLQSNPDLGEEFNKSMTSYAGMIPFPGSFAKAYDFSKAKHVVDVGGGYGVLLTEILLAHPHLTGTTFDQPSTIAETKNPINLPKDFSQVKERFSYAAGSFFDVIPEGGDVYTVKFVIHNWNDAEATQILKNIHKAMPAHGKLVAIEREVGELDDTLGCMLDLHVMVMLDGIERTREGHTKIFRDAGFKITNYISLPCAPPAIVYAIEGEKI